MSQYVIADPPTIVNHSHQTMNTGNPSVVWQQQMEKAYIRRYNIMHMIDKSLPTYKYDCTDYFNTQFGPLPEVFAYDIYFVDPQYSLEPFWDESYMIKTNWSTKILTTNLMTKLKVIT